MAPEDRKRALAVTRGLTPADVARLRRGDLEAHEVAALLDRTAGLAAPAAPPEGDLVPNGTGWRVGEGGLAKRIHPRLWKWAMFSPMLAGLGNVWATLLGIHHSFLAPMLLGLVPFALLLGSVKLACAIELRPLERSRTPQRLAECPSGTSVRLEGVVASAATVPTLFRGVPAVLFKSALGLVEQTQGIDFDLDMDDGQRARIAVRRAVLLDRAARTREPPACGPVSIAWSWFEPDRDRLTSSLLTGPSPSRVLGETRRYEASIAPGDRIEVCGVLHHEPDPDARAPFARQMPTRAVIRAGSKLPLLVRRLG